jgi:hypothetical protein
VPEDEVRKMTLDNCARFFHLNSAAYSCPSPITMGQGR